MASVNKVILIGNLGKDPETRYLPSGDAVCNFSIATTEKWKGSDGNTQEHTEWHRISFFGRRAEVAGEYLRKGSSVYIEGRIRTRKWQDKDGNDRYNTEIVGDQLKMLGSKPADGQRREPASTGGQTATDPAANKPVAQTPRKTTGGFDEMDDDIPF